MTQATTYVFELFEDHPTLYIFVGILAACLLFWCRTGKLWMYGLIELGVGLGLMILSINVTGSFDRSFSRDFDVVRATVSWTTYLGAIFVLVRGLDNIWTSLGRRKS